MKIEQALVLYLLKHKSMSLEGLGTFTVDAPIPEVTDNERPVVIPSNAVSFQYNPKVAEDERIVDFIVENTKKIKPLASADLNSFLTLGRQFLNIGKPFTIQNLGTLEKMKSGELEFKPGQVVLQKMEPPRDVTENNLEENDKENLFNDYRSSESGRGKKVFVTLLMILIIAAAGWAAWNYLFRKETPPPHEVIVPIAEADNTSIDSSTYIPLVDSSSFTPVTDSISYNIVIQEATNQKQLLQRLSTLRSYGRNVVVVTDDSVKYKLITPMKGLPSDTAKIIDSLNKHFYLGKAYIELR
ncbi:hypothetical protein BH20BAC1_BH20BAC1_20080 [soil metagenome]